jgi:hypothetical protein
MSIRETLISAGVGNLRQFGYPTCDSENILTDLIFSAFFVQMLKENKGAGDKIDAEIDAIIAEIELSQSREGK